MRATDIDITGNRKTGFVISEKKKKKTVQIFTFWFICHSWRGWFCRLLWQRHENQVLDKSHDGSIIITNFTLVIRINTEGKYSSVLVCRLSKIK